MPKRIFNPLLVLFALLLFSCSQKEKITVLAAAGLKEPITQLVNLYEKNRKGVEVNLVLQGSGDLLTLLEAKKGDLYIPAAASYMGEAVRRKLIDPKTVGVLAYHVPVLVVKEDKAKGVKNLDDILQRSLKIGIGDPKAAAIGKLSVEILKRLGLYGRFMKKVVVETATVNQLLLYLRSGQLDAAIVWKELARKLKGFKVIPLGGEVEKVEVGITTFSKNRKAAEDFEKFLLKHSEVFEKEGFSP